jgi:hypothetical protein
LHTLAASLTTPAGQDPTVLTLDTAAGELLLGFEHELEPRLAAGSGDLAQLAGWAAKLAGATCRIAALLHLAGHLRDGWMKPIAADTLAGAIRLAGYLVELARAVFDLMGTDSQVDDARWLLDWITRTNRSQFTRRDPHQAAPRGRFPNATDLDPALRLLEEHGYLRWLDADPPGPKGGRPPSLVAALGVQPAAQPQGHGDYRKPPALPPASLLRPPTAPPDHPSIVLRWQNDLESRLSHRLLAVPATTPRCQAARLRGRPRPPAGRPDHRRRGEHALQLLSTECAQAGPSSRAVTPGSAPVMVRPRRRRAGSG